MFDSAWDWPCLGDHHLWCLKSSSRRSWQVCESCAEEEIPLRRHSVWTKVEFVLIPWCSGSGFSIVPLEIFEDRHVHHVLYLCNLKTEKTDFFFFYFLQKLLVFMLLLVLRLFPFKRGRSFSSAPQSDRCRGWWLWGWYLLLAEVFKIGCRSYLEVATPQTNIKIPIVWTGCSWWLCFCFLISIKKVFTT